MASLSNFDQRQTFNSKDKEVITKPLLSMRKTNCAFSVPPMVPAPDPSIGLSEFEVPAVTGRQVLDVVCAVYDVTIQDLKGPRRARRVARPRQVAMYFSRLLCPHLSLPMIGIMLGGRDHTTIMHGCRQIEGLLHYDKELAEKCQAVSDLLGEAAK